MQSSTLTVTALDGTSLHVNRWLPDGTAKAVVQIAHGMAEHSGRYARFAERLTADGYAVYAGDHRGHGATAAGAEDEGYFADHAGFATVVDDLHLVTQRAKTEHPGLPFFLFGHSMGSFLSRSYAARFGDELDGLVLTGTGGDPGLLGKVGHLVAATEGRVRGRRHTSGLLNTLTFGPYNKAFKPNRTEFDWLSRDGAEVDKYIADPWCGNVFTSGFFADLLGGLAQVNADETVTRTPKDLPIHLVSGSMDPVGGQTKGVQQVASQYRRLGVEDVTTMFWPGARHEVLNETNRDEVTDEIVDWLDAHLPVAPS
ncbi:MAG: alpha/beta hydrolase [Intrasporangium sp.]|uniref:alpha/beta hydrolase n=1 Tax=Intrasporangium sp. TaxID=1925024 RepID=UPI00264928CF|nr:alpha/beta hydrolase [Intrasporangium sp.]MDN5795999.1 alpha/beta hydrolase [Intrasporangium sp.]